MIENFFLYKTMDVAPMKKIIEMLAQPSTWRGIALLGAALGYPITEETQGALVQVSLGIASLISIFWES